MPLVSLVVEAFPLLFSGVPSLLLGCSAPASSTATVCAALAFDNEDVPPDSKEAARSSTEVAVSAAAGAATQLV